MPCCLVLPAVPVSVQPICRTYSFRDRAFKPVNLASSLSTRLFRELSLTTEQGYWLNPLWSQYPENGLRTWLAEKYRSFNRWLLLVLLLSQSYSNLLACD